MIESKTDAVPAEKLETADSQRRNFAMALLGALGASALASCAKDGESDPLEAVDRAAQALSGVPLLKFADTLGELQGLAGETGGGRQRPSPY